MGMEHTVTFTSPPPPWPTVRDLLIQRGVAVQLKMIDNQLAFPDEDPTEDWRELRVGNAAGMVTLRRAQDRIALVVWGNADPALQSLWNALTWAWAKAGAGSILTPGGTKEVEAFEKEMGLAGGG